MIALDHVPSEPVYEAGFDELLKGCRRHARRIRRGLERADDRDELRAYCEALAELQALYRADLRVLVELGDERHGRPLEVALLHAEELLRDGLTLRSIPAETREALRSRRAADWTVLMLEPTPVESSADRLVQGFLEPGGGDNSPTD